MMLILINHKEVSAKKEVVVDDEILVVGVAGNTHQPLVVAGVVVRWEHDALKIDVGWERQDAKRNQPSFELQTGLAIS